LLQGKQTNEARKVGEAGEMICSLRSVRGCQFYALPVPAVEKKGRGRGGERDRGKEKRRTAKNRRVRRLFFLLSTVSKRDGSSLLALPASSVDVIIFSQFFPASRGIAGPFFENRGHWVTEIYFPRAIADVFQ
jgi:hypothetical protein